MNYQELINQILQLEEEGLEIFNAGKSVLGKNIFSSGFHIFYFPKILDLTILVS